MSASDAGAGRAAAAPAAVPGPAAAADHYPVQLEIDYTRKHSRIMLFLRLLLVIPHLVVLTVLYVISSILTLVAAVAVLITRHYPKGIFNFNVGVARYGWRVTAYMLMLTDRFPPFALTAHEKYPVRFRIEYPGSVARWRVLFAWLVALPVLLIVYVLMAVLEILTFLVFFILLITARYPKGLFGLNVGILRLNARAGAYAGFMCTQYPPFDLAG
ncbi:MAG: DUF4389 domain-containing protein [Actinobacteria bacterium]|nr:MAG: DUF4389 domain-containing protein [Actinomycetota bacterium]